MTEQIYCGLDGGLLLMDSDRLDALERVDFTEGFDPAGEFSIAFDVRGKTDHIDDFPDEPWPAVWRRETQGLVALVNKGEMALLILQDGEFFVDLNLDGPPPPLVDTKIYRSRLELPTGKLSIVEPGYHIEHWGVPTKPDLVRLRHRRLEVAPGWYVATFFVAKSPLSREIKRVWTYGTSDDPAIHVRLERSASPVPPIGELFHHPFTIGAT